MDLFSQIEDNNEDKKLDKKTDNYDEYYALSDYHKRCLPTTNFWKIVNGEEPISVPAGDINYHREFTPKYEKKAKQLNIRLYAKTK